MKDRRIKPPDLVVTVRWQGKLILLSEGDVDEGDDLTLAQSTRCDGELEKEQAVFFLEKTIACLLVGSSDPAKPTVLATDDSE